MDVLGNGYFLVRVQVAGDGQHHQCRYEEPEPQYEQFAVFVDLRQIIGDKHSIGLGLQLLRHSPVAICNDIEVWLSLCSEASDCV